MHTMSYKNYTKYTLKAFSDNKVVQVTKLYSVGMSTLNVMVDRKIDRQIKKESTRQNMIDVALRFKMLQRASK